VYTCALCFVDGVDAEMETVLGELAIELDGRFSSVRNSETNLGINLYLFVLLYDTFVD